MSCSETDKQLLTALQRAKAVTVDHGIVCGFFSSGFLIQTESFHPTTSPDLRDRLEKITLDHPLCLWMKILPLTDNSYHVTILAGPSVRHECYGIEPNLTDAKLCAFLDFWEWVAARNDSQAEP